MIFCDLIFKSIFRRKNWFWSSIEIDSQPKYSIIICGIKENQVWWVQLDSRVYATGTYKFTQKKLVMTKNSFKLRNHFFIVFLRVLNFSECPTKIDLNFLKRKNPPILIFHNFSHRLPILQSLVSSSIRLRRRSTSSMGKMYRRWSELWNKKWRSFFSFYKFRIFDRTFKEIEDLLRKTWIRGSVIWMNFLPLLTFSE